MSPMAQKRGRSKRDALTLPADALSITVVKGRHEGDAYEEVEGDATVLLQVGALSQQAVALGKAAKDLSSTTYILRFKPDVAQRLLGGELEMMRASGGGIRANVIDSAGTIRGQGSLHEVARFGTAVFAVWQALALITAQKFLADINHRLIGLESSVRDIQRWLDNDRRARLRRGLTRVREVNQALRLGTLPASEYAAFRSQLDDIDGDAGAAVEALTAHDGDLAQLHSRLQAQVLNDRHLEKNTAAAMRIIDQFVARCAELHMALMCRAAASQLRYGLTGSFATELPIFQGIEQVLWNHAERVRTFHATARLRYPEVRGTFSRESTDKAHRDRLQAHIEEHLPKISEGVGAFLRQVREVLALLQIDRDEAADGIALMVTRGADGSIERIYRPSRQAALANARNIGPVSLDEFNKAGAVAALARLVLFLTSGGRA